MRHRLCHTGARQAEPGLHHEILRQASSAPNSLFRAGQKQAGNLGRHLGPDSQSQPRPLTTPKKILKKSENND